jgi:hypothetical protein
MTIPIEIVVAAITSTLGLVGVIITAVFSYANSITAKDSRRIIEEINDAVNHRHDKKGPDAPKLYDLIWENHKKSDELIQWKRSYDDGPMEDGTKATVFFIETQNRLDKIESTIEKLSEIVRKWKDEK